jgi:hypothetical protein
LHQIGGCIVQTRWRFWAAVAVGGLSAVLAVMTLVSREWIEIFFRVDFDHGNGSLEWVIVVITAAIAVICLSWARVEWRRAHPVAG